MRINIKSGATITMVALAVSACSQQQVAPESVVIDPVTPIVQAPINQVPAVPYVEEIIQPAPMKPAPLPPIVVKPKPAPVVVAPAPIVVAPAPVYVPPVKAKGTYRGAIPISADLQQYRQ